MRIFLSLLAALLVAASASTPLPAHAKDKKAAKREAQQAAFAALQRGEILQLTRIMQIATGIVPGDIIEIEYKSDPKYKVKILTPEGRIREIELDARTGELLKIKDK